MALNLKNPETERLAKELAGLTGESLTSAITQAVRERLERERKRCKPGMNVAKILALGRACAAEMKVPTRSEDHNLLYDELGLPR